MDIKFGNSFRYNLSRAVVNNIMIKPIKAEKVIVGSSQPVAAPQNGSSLSKSNIAVGSSNATDMIFILTINAAM